MLGLNFSRIGSAAVLFSLCGAADSRADEYLLQGSRVPIVAMSPDGTQIAGFQTLSGQRIPFIWSQCDYDFPSVDAGDSRGTDLTLDGLMAVGTRTVLSNPFVTILAASRWGQPSGDLPVPFFPANIQSTGASAVSHDGRLIVGWARPAFDSVRACVWETFGSTFARTLDAPTESFDYFATCVNPGRTWIAGHSFDQAVRWTLGGEALLLGHLGGGSARSHAVTDCGVVVGESVVPNGEVRAFLWREGEGMIDLGTLGGPYSAALAASCDGSVVVGTSLINPTSSARRAFVWTPHTGMVDLSSRVLPGSQLFFAELFTATEVSANGQVIAGTAGQEGFFESGFLLGFQPDPLGPVRISLEPQGCSLPTSTGAPSLSADGGTIAYNMVFIGLPPTYARVSTSGTDTLHEGDSSPSVSGDGAAIATRSLATGIPGQPFASTEQVIVRDNTGGITLASVRLDGAPASRSCTLPTISNDGRSVAFLTDAPGLVSTPVGGLQLYVRDLDTQTTALVSDGHPEITPQTWSGDLRYVVFKRFVGTNALGRSVFELFVHDRQTGVTTQETGGGLPLATSDYLNVVISESAGLTTDGRYLAFYSNASQVVANPDAFPGGQEGIYVKDRMTGRTEIVSISRGNAYAAEGAAVRWRSSWSAPSISDDGRFVAFVCNGDFAAYALDPHVGQRFGPAPSVSDHVFMVHDRLTRATQAVAFAPGVVLPGAQGLVGGESIRLSRDGQRVVFVTHSSLNSPLDFNGSADIFSMPTPVQTGRAVAFFTTTGGQDLGRWSQLTPDGEVLMQAVSFAGCSHRWYRAGVPLSDGVLPSGALAQGATSSRLHLSGLRSVDQAAYTCRVTDARGRVFESDELYLAGLGLASGTIVGNGFPAPLTTQPNSLGRRGGSGSGSTGGGLASASVDVVATDGATDISITGTARHDSFSGGFTAVTSVSPMQFEITEPTNFVVLNTSTGIDDNGELRSVSPATLYTISGQLVGDPAAGGTLAPGTYAIRFGVAAFEREGLLPAFGGVTYEEWYGTLEPLGLRETTVSWILRLSPTGSVCRADFNGDGNLDPDDLGDYINCFFSASVCSGADFNADGNTDPDDLGDFINEYFSGCN